VQRVLFGLLIGLLVTCGCSPQGGAPTAKVSGVLTRKGSPVPNASVTFTPETGRPANGVTDAQGKFTLSTFATNDGAVPGTHRVSVASMDIPPMPGTPEARSGTAQSQIPPKYTSPETSGFVAEVKTRQKNEFTFDIPE
jgi:hypothetical protein